MAVLSRPRPVESQMQAVHLGLDDLPCVFVDVLGQRPLLCRYALVAAGRVLSALPALAAARFVLQKLRFGLEDEHVANAVAVPLAERTECAAGGHVAHLRVLAGGVFLVFVEVAALLSARGVRAGLL